MIPGYFKIRDKCREGLLKYLAEAFSFVEELEEPGILDIGCGSGVPSLWLAGNLSGYITAVDPDNNALNGLREKIRLKKLENRVTVLNASFPEFNPGREVFDIILAEGFLNIVGFFRGFQGLIDMLRHGGYFVIHDEFAEDDKKRDFRNNNHCNLIGSVFLDEKIWWNDYYRQLEAEISKIRSDETRKLFMSDMKEIDFYRSDPASFKSIYYVVKKL